MDSALADTLVDTVLDGRYHVDSVLARGGMSTVYAGTDLRLERPVAIKVMAPSFADDQVFVDRFIQEARTAARLSHVNIVPVHDQGEDAGRVFLVMELVRGQTLRGLLREQGRLSPELAVSVMESVLAALSVAHRAGLVHRDVKPENVLISDDGLVKVTDFGLSRAVAATSSTQSGIVMGTAAYVAPEQVSRGVADARADVYAAGVVLYEMLTGVPPYTGDTAVSIAYRHVHEDVPPPSLVAPDTPPELDDLVCRATSRDAADRPFDAGAMLAELHDVRVGLGMRPTPVPPPATRTRVDLRPPNRTRMLGNVPPAPAAPAEPPRSPPFVVRGLPRDVEPVRSSLPDYDEERRGARLRGVLGLSVVLLLALAAAGTGWWFGAGRYTGVPDVRGMSREQAVDTVRTANLRPAAEIRQVFDDTAPPGEITGTDPERGSRVTRGSSVTLLVSKGPEIIEIPDTIGESAERAKEILGQAGFEVVVAGDGGDDALVIAQEPAGGSAPKGSTVTITVGPELVEVPDVRLDPVDEAVDTLESLGFEVHTRSILRIDAPGRDRVWAQDVEPGSKVPPGTVINLTVF